MSQKKQQLIKSGSTIPVGILHSLSGTMAISEKSLKDAELMAIAEINAAGGILGKTIEPIIEDGESEPTTFALKTRKLIEQDQVATIFGGWTSACRKALLPVLEELNTLLWYPVEYEGLECSPNIFYSGTCPNQQVEPAVDWLLQNKGASFYLIGSDYVFPRTANKLIKAQLRRQGGKLVGEEYALLGSTEFQEAIQRIKSAKPDVVFSTLNGDSNLAFYQQYQAAGITPQEIPIMAISVGEEELRRIGSSSTGHYASWSYFQSIDRPVNRTFVENFQRRYGQERVTSDPIEAAYVQVYLWKQAVETAGSVDVDLVREAAYGQTFDAPGGIVCVEQNHHLWKHCHIGQILDGGQLEVVFTSNGLIKPQPWLGIEELGDQVPPVVFDMLGEVTQSIQYNCQLEQAMTQLRATNNELRQTQEALLQSKARENLLKRRLSSQIRISLDLDKILQSAVEEIRNILDIDCCQFFWCEKLANPPDWQLMQGACESILPMELKFYSIAGELELLLSQLLKQPSLLCINDISSDSQLNEASRSRLEKLGVKALLIAPIQTRSQKIGVVVCENFRTPHPWEHSEVELITSVVDQLANAIDQAELFEQSRTAADLATAHARQLQKALDELHSSQARLVQSEKMSTLGTLVAGVAHEINNPISFIYGNLHYAKEYIESLLKLVNLYQQNYSEPLPSIEAYAEAIDLDFLIEDLPKTLSSMQTGAERIRNLVLSLRNFSRLDRLQMEAVDIHEGIDSTLLILNNRLKGKSGNYIIEVIKEYGEIPLVECYPSQLNQVFMNIISNAIDTLEESINKGKMTEPPRIWIRTDISFPEKINICIADNGLGITEETKRQLFDPFFTTKPVGKGTGLGLSISYKIVVERHGGILRCESLPGEGSQFLIEIPLQQSSKSCNHSSVSVAAT
ncbi:MAG: urea ABC transporter substrate-binding protein [Symploca sp. SIO1B1]|nr:urea ABC transporter substrate-binding protein [Symploca sp. SIO1B1]